MSSNPTIKFNAKTFGKLNKVNDVITYVVARQTLDVVGSSEATAYRSGETQRSMYSNGVQADAQGYYIGDFTNYASRVYKMKNVNWTNKKTRPQWFHTIWQEQGELILDNCIRRYLWTEI